MLGSPMLLVEGLLFGSAGRSAAPLVALAELLYLGGWMCSAIGLRRLRATGDTSLGRVIFAIQVVGLCLAAVFTLLEAFAPGAHDSALYQITDAAWPFNHLFMIVVGIVTLRAKVWGGWQRWTPLLCGLALPAAMPPERWPESPR
jgi:hypothetical protein